jgi:NADPH2:quinone reductase
VRAMVLPAFGPPDVFRLEDLPTPSPGPGELLVRVVAASLNPVDAKIRASGHWAGITPPAVLGYDASGVVEAVGPGVREFRVGDEVFYTPEIYGNPLGTYAERNVVPAAIVAPKPASLGHLEAAAIPLAGGTAWEAVVRRLALRPGETVLILGGAGGVGHFAVQFAKAAGARVLATASGANQATLRELRVDVPIDYEREDAASVALEVTEGRGVDAVFDTVGSDLLARSLTALRPFGRAAVILAPEGDLTLLSRRNLTLHGIFLTRERRRLEEMLPLFVSGHARPIVDQVLPLERVAEGHRRLDSRHGRGKVVLQVSSPPR